MAKGTRASRLNRRLDALDALDPQRSQVYATALSSLTHLWNQGRRVGSVSVRRSFIETHTPGVAPPASRLISSRGHSLRVALLALFIAQNKRGSAQHLLNVPLIAKQSEDVAWADLIVSAPRIGPGSTARGARAKRAISARAALNRLSKPEISLMDRPGSAQRKGGYDVVHLFEDTGPRALGSPVSYTTPGSGEDVVTIPVEFFLHGWIYVLEDTEIVTYLMYRHLCSRSSPAPAHISAHDRESRYGINQAAWEQYWLLENAGLLLVQADENRRADGTFADQSSGAKPLRHRFTTHDEGLQQDGLHVIWAAVDARTTAG